MIEKTPITHPIDSRPQAAHLVWFKRDLRLDANAALAQAINRSAQSGHPIVGLFVVEPEYWALPDTSDRQWQFQAQCLAELRTALFRLGIPLLVRQGTVAGTLDKMHSHLPLASIDAHEETGNNWTFQRDRAVLAWARQQAIALIEHKHFGVIRRMKDRNGWADSWDRQMKQALPTVRMSDDHIQHQALVLEYLDQAAIPQGAIPSAADIHANATNPRDVQTGSREGGLSLVNSFLTQRGQHYRWAMSKPFEGFTACSRVSAHLSYGAVSMAEVFQSSLEATLARRGEALRAGEPIASVEMGERPVDKWLKAYSSFRGRLHWHCHFMQKLEDRPDIEWQNMHRAYDGIRPDQVDQNRLDAWAHGQTGYPFVDACMRALRATGYLNFRARAMVVSFASYQLWLDWRHTGPVLAGLFTDYEPGIHWSQMQMQSGTTGINSIRIYNPVKQSQDHDAAGRFIRLWVPELSGLDDKQIHQPWLTPKSLWRQYANPIVDLSTATAFAKDRIWGVRKQPEHRAQAQAVFQALGSRAGSRDNRIATRRKKAIQAEIDAVQPKLI